VPRLPRRPGTARRAVAGIHLPLLNSPERSLRSVASLTLISSPRRMRSAMTNQNWIHLIELQRWFTSESYPQSWDWRRNSHDPPRKYTYCLGICLVQPIWGSPSSTAVRTSTQSRTTRGIPRPQFLYPDMRGWITFIVGGEEYYHWGPSHCA